MGCLGSCRSLSSFPDFISVTSMASSYGDTAASAAVKNCGGDYRLERRCDWVVLGFNELVTERLRILVLRDIFL